MIEEIGKWGGFMSENKLVKITTVNSLAEAEQIIQYLKENGVSAMRQGGIMDVYTSNSIAGEDIMIDENQLRIAEKLLKELVQICILMWPINGWDVITFIMIWICVKPQ